MLIIKHSVVTTATVSQIWQVWQDVETWNSWDEGIEYAYLDGPFEAGTSGGLKPKEGPLLKTKLVKIEPYRLFVQEARLLCAQVIMTHVITTTNNGITEVTFQTDIQGPLAFFYTFLLGRSIRKKIPIEMKAMLEKAILING